MSGYCSHQIAMGHCVFRGCIGAPKPITEKCWACLGTGSIPRDPNSLALGLRKPCGMCGGSGVVECRGKP